MLSMGIFTTPNQIELFMYLLTLGPKIIVGADLDKKNLANKNKVKHQPQQPAKPKTKKPIFSRRSRNNLIKVLNGLSEMPDFLMTLSYPDSIGETPKEWKNDLDLLRRRLKYQYPQSWWVWRIEPQGKTGKPHYHIVGSTGEQTDQHELWQWLQQRWCKIVGLDPKQDQFATDVKEVEEDSGKLERYICKPETGPYNDYWDGWLKLTNRWGKINANNIPMADTTSFKVGQETLDDIKDMVLASIESQIRELEDKLGAMTLTTSHRDRHTIEKAIKGKKDYMYRIRFTGDFFGLLAPDHMKLIRMYLEDRKAKGKL